MSRLYSVFDSASEAFSAPFTQVNKVTAQREFAGLVERDQRIAGRPEFYSLFELAEFDESSGRIETGGMAPLLICTAQDCITAANARKNNHHVHGVEVSK